MVSCIGKDLVWVRWKKLSLFERNLWLEYVDSYVAIVKERDM